MSLPSQSLPGGAGSWRRSTAFTVEFASSRDGATLRNERVFCYGRTLMRRLVDGDRGYHERLFRTGGRSWSKAVYPPACRPDRGPVRFATAPDGSLVLHVNRRELADDDVRLRMLFATGAAVFPTRRDLTAFAHGPLARAFGIDVPAGEDPDDDLADGGGDPLPGAGDAAAPAAATASDEVIVSADRIATQLSRVVYGQDAALERVAQVVSTQLAKRAPRRPAVVMLLGPTGTGKTHTVEALPAVLESLGRHGAHLFRVDCNELTQSFQVARLIGAPPGYVGHDTPPRLLAALAAPGCILLLDEVDRAHPSVVGDVLLNLLDTGRLTAPDGSPVHAEHAIIVMTSNAGSDELATRLHRVELGNRWAVQRACREHLAELGLPADLIGRVGAYAVYADLDEDAVHRAAVLAVKHRAQEYPLRVPEVDPIVAGAIVDIAGACGLGARGVAHAAAELLAPAFAAAVCDGLRGAVVLDPGPPPAVRSRVTTGARSTMRSRS
jgi:hypothetical protein